MTRTHIPEEVLTAAHDRARARAVRDWALADRLRGEIETAGWTIVDRGTDFALSPAAPPDVDEGARVRYGTSRNVPARFDEPATGLATVVLIATDWPADIERALAGLRAYAPAGTSVVVVADAPSDEQAAALEALETSESGPGREAGNEAPEEGAAADLPTEIVWTSERLGHGAATNIGIRRAESEIVILLDTSVAPTGDFVTPLVRALGDAEVAVVGGWGVTSGDLRTFDDAPAGEVDAIEGYVQAFRRSDAAAFGPLDERFRFYRNLDIWWSLVLRDGAEDDETPRRAIGLEGLPLERHEHRGWTSLPDEERDRQSKRNFYRIIDRFGARRDLLVSGRPKSDIGVDEAEEPDSGADLIDRLQRTLGIGIVIESIETTEPKKSTESTEPPESTEPGASVAIRATLLYGSRATRVVATGATEADAWKDLARAAIAWRNADYQHIPMWPGGG